jgi:rare lipoprotein A
MFTMRAKMISVGLLGAAVMLPLNSALADQVGHASWYALHSRTASGEMMNPSELTAAHRSLPFGTRVLVENLNNGRSVVVRINDRGPFVGGRIIDLSKAAAASIGMLGSGTARVRVTTAGGSNSGNVIAALGAASSKAKKGTQVAAAAAADSTPPRPERAPRDEIAKAPAAAKVEQVAYKTPARHASAKHVASKHKAKSYTVASRSSAKGTRLAARTAAGSAKHRGSIAVASNTKTGRSERAYARRFASNSSAARAGWRYGAKIAQASFGRHAGRDLS